MTDGKLLKNGINNLELTDLAKVEQVGGREETSLRPGRVEDGSSVTLRQDEPGTEQQNHDSIAQINSLSHSGKNYGKIYKNSQTNYISQNLFLHL